MQLAKAPKIRALSLFANFLFAFDCLLPSLHRCRITGDVDFLIFVKFFTGTPYTDRSQSSGIRVAETHRAVLLRGWLYRQDKLFSRIRCK